MANTIYLPQSSFLIYIFSLFFLTFVGCQKDGFVVEGDASSKKATEVTFSYQSDETPNLVKHVPYTYLHKTSDTNYKLYVCIANEILHQIQFSSQTELNGVHTLEYMTVSSTNEQTDYFFDVRAIPFNPLLPNSSIEIKVFDQLIQDTHLMTLDFADADEAPLNIPEGSSIAENSPYVYLRNPEDDDNLFFPRVLIPLLGFSFDSENIEMPESANGTFVGTVILYEDSNEEPSILIPGQINSSSYIDGEDLDGFFETIVFRSGPCCRPTSPSTCTPCNQTSPSGHIRNMGADTK